VVVDFSAFRRLVTSPATVKSKCKSKSTVLKSKTKSESLEPMSKSKSSKNGLKSGLESKSGLEYYKSGFWYYMTV